jgi:hypothetical protein
LLVQGPGSDFVHTVMKLRVAYKTGNFLTNGATIMFLRRPLYCVQWT